jgi:hypothetical protein
MELLIVFESLLTEGFNKIWNSRGFMKEGLGIGKRTYYFAGRQNPKTKNALVLG